MDVEEEIILLNAEVESIKTILRDFGEQLSRR
jgi:hypothetical protein